MSSVPLKARGEKITILTASVAAATGLSPVAHRDDHSEHAIKGQLAPDAFGPSAHGPKVEASSGHNGLEPESSEGKRGLKRKVPEGERNMTKDSREETESTRPEKRTKQPAAVNLPSRHVLSIIHAQQEFQLRIDEWRKEVDEQTRGIRWIRGGGYTGRKWASLSPNAAPSTQILPFAWLYFKQSM